MLTPCSFMWVTALCGPVYGWGAWSRAPTTVVARPDVKLSSGAVTHATRPRGGRQRADLLVVHGTPLADVTRLCRRESLTLVMQDGPSSARALKPTRRDGP